MVHTVSFSLLFSGTFNGRVCVSYTHMHTHTHAHTGRHPRMHSWHRQPTSVTKETDVGVCVAYTRGGVFASPGAAYR